MKIYHYDPTTKTLIGEGFGDADPLVEDGWLIPAHATAVEPPPPVQGKFCKFDGSKWSQVDVPPPPAPVTPTAPPFAELKAAELAKFFADREKMLNRLSGMIVRAGVRGDLPKQLALTTLSEDLLLLPSAPAVVGAIRIDELKLAMKAQYRQVIANIPAAYKAEFLKVEQ